MPAGTGDPRKGDHILSPFFPAAVTPAPPSLFWSTFSHHLFVSYLPVPSLSSLMSFPFPCSLQVHTCAHMHTWTLVITATYHSFAPL